MNCYDCNAPLDVRADPLPLCRECDAYASSEEPHASIYEQRVIAADQDLIRAWANTYGPEFLHMPTPDLRVTQPRKKETK